MTSENFGVNFITIGKHSSFPENVVSCNILHTAAAGFIVFVYKSLNLSVCCFKQLEFRRGFLKSQTLLATY